MTLTWSKLYSGNSGETILNYSFEDFVVCLSVGEYLWLATAASQRSHGLCVSSDTFIVSVWPTAP